VAADTEAKMAVAAAFAEVLVGQADLVDISVDKVVSEVDEVAVEVVDSEWEVVALQMLW